MNSSEECKTVSGTKEWAEKKINCLDGCCHNCAYCNARSMARRFGRMSPDEWQYERVRLSNFRNEFLTGIQIKSAPNRFSENIYYYIHFDIF